MSIRSACDGCHATGVPLTERGVVAKLDYCPTCLPVVDAYRAALDSAHDHVASLWKSLRHKAELEALAQGVKELPL